MGRLQVIILLSCGFMGSVVSWQDAFDQQMYQDVLDEEICNRQLELLNEHPLRRQFLDASAKIPSGILTGNLANFGDYHQCLSIDGLVQNMRVQGKYCAILVPLQQEPIDWPSIPDWNITLPEIPGLNFTTPSPGLPEVDPETVAVVERYSKINLWAHKFAGHNEDDHSRIFPVLLTAQYGMTLGVCIPKACTARQALTHWQQAVPFLNVEFQEFYYRLPGDKPFVAGDYVAM
uniref:Nose resistant-to-fluoxetine protein N-terminal domain-containing protein n=1 Tax=Pectinophora gossypiella TaxID=13191 RepID=A0A1E1WHK0_PECGO